MLIDTHCHLHDTEWFSPEQAEAALVLAHKDSVEKIIVIGTDPEDSSAARNFAAKHKNVFWTYGVHPEGAGRYSHATARDFSESWRSDAPADAGQNHGPQGLDFESVPVMKKSYERSQDTSNRKQKAPVAIGEIGLDYHYDGYDRKSQIALFEQMLQLALDLDLPVSLHIREAFTDAFAILDNFSGIRGVVHSFTGSKKELKQALDRGFHIGVNGLCTYTTNPLPPLDRMLLETDAPFLTPAPFRGSTNQPKYIKTIAEFFAQHFAVDFAEIASITTKNATQLFQI